jgi:hypothetical protein
MTTHDTTTNKCADYLHVLTQPKKAKKLPRLVEVLWMDAVGTGVEWETPEETDQYQPEPTMSVGYVWEHTTTHIHLISTLNTMHTANGIVIPNPCIKRITELKR